MCVVMYTHAHLNTAPWSLEECNGLPGTGLGSSCELPDMTVGKQNQVLCKNTCHNH